MRRYLAVFAAFAMVLAIALPAAAYTTTPTSNGTWYAYPGQATSYGAAVQQPLNVDGSSNFKANGKAVIPVKFALSQGTSAFAFESIFSDTSAMNNYSFLEFDPTVQPTLADITELIADYAFTTGDCAGGSLRWTVYLFDPVAGAWLNLDIHYQPGTFASECVPGTSGSNMADLTSTEPYVVIQAFNHAPYTFTSSYNVTYAEAVSQLGGLSVWGMNLALDGGWADSDGVAGQDDQVVNLTSATVSVGGTIPYTETFTPQPASAMTQVCPTAEATISISKVDGAPLGAVNEPLTIQPQDNDGIFRIVDCKYIYNLATSSLSGVGTYTVEATIGSTTFIVANFDLR